VVVLSSRLVDCLLVFLSGLHYDAAGCTVTFYVMSSLAFSVAAAYGILRPFRARLVNVVAPLAYASLGVLLTLDAVTIRHPSLFIESAKSLLTVFLVFTAASRSTVEAALSILEHFAQSRLRRDGCEENARCAPPPLMLFGDFDSASSEGVDLHVDVTPEEAQNEWWTLPNPPELRFAQSVFPPAEDSGPCRLCHAQQTNTNAQDPFDSALLSASSTSIDLTEL
jgi:hypothetical protein